MFGKDKDKQKKKKEKMNGKAGHSEENYNVLYDNLAFPLYAIKQAKTKRYRGNRRRAGKLRQCGYSRNQCKER